MVFENLTDDNIILYAVKAYDRPLCIQAEFESDFKKLKYLKRLFRKYKNGGELKERLILNHIVILYNVFGESATRILFYKVDEKDYDVLKTFLAFLNYLPKAIFGIRGKTIFTDRIPFDNEIDKKLRTL